MLAICLPGAFGGALAAQSPFGSALDDALPGAGGGAPFKVTARIEPDAQAPGHPVIAVVRFSCPKGHYIYWDTISVKLDETAGGQAPVSAGKLHLPRAKTKRDKWLEKDVQYLDGEFEARLVLRLVVPRFIGARESRTAVTLKVGYQGCSPELCFAPASEQFTLSLNVLAADAEPVPVQLPSEVMREPSPAAAGQEAARIEESFVERSLLVALIVAYLAGLGLSITPCVYPMIPITVSVIGAAATERRLSAFARSLLYVLGISVTYALLGVIAAVIGQAFGTVLQHPAVYLVLAALFLAMGVAMFGGFTIQLPQSWTGRLQASVRGKWGLLGVLALGLLSGVALTPCGAPVVVAAISYVTRTGRPLTGFLILFAIAWGMGTPLVVLGTFSGLIKALPKSGGWQETVKHLFGLGLLAGALYFVWMSGVLPPVWVQIVLGGFLLVASVFVGAFDFYPPNVRRAREPLTGQRRRGARPPHEGRVNVRKALGLLLLAGAAIALLQPVFRGIGGEPADRPAIQWVTSESDALAAAGREGKPLMLYFWQERCRECVKLSKSTFPEAGVVAQSRRFVCLKFDGTAAGSPEVRRVLDQYAVKVFPTIVFADSGGEVLGDLTTVGHASPGELIKTMRSAAPAEGSE